MMVGRILSSRYELLNKIGDGGMSVVYKAKDTILNRIVAVKILREQYTTDAEFKERFRREAQSVAALYHPNIVNVFDVGEDDGLNYIVMELVDGEPLNEIIRREGALDPERAVLIVAQILDALAHAHLKDVIHRDVKPHNIIVSKDGLAKITDFGIAKAFAASGLTQTGIVIGTVNYTSPEQAKGQTAMKESDLYSLGVVLYEALTGKPPFEADTQVGVAMKHVRDIPALPTTLNSKIPKDLERVLMKALLKQPEERWQDARLFKAALMRTNIGINLAKNRASLLQIDVNDALIQDEYTKKFLAQEGVEDLASKNGKRNSKGSKKPNKKNVAVLTTIFVGVAVIVAVGFFSVKAFIDWINVPEVSVPSVVGVTLDEATRLLNDASLKFEISSRNYDEKVPIDYVISQDPAAGEVKKRDAIVRLIVSLGNEIIEVPDFKGLTFRDAQFLAENNGLIVEVTSQEHSEEVPKDKVVSQSFMFGAKVLRGTTVGLIMSDGPEQLFTVPSVIGKTENAAKQAIINAGFHIGNVRYEDNLIYADGAVIEQVPGPIEKVALGSYVDIVVCKKDISSSSSNTQPNAKFEEKIVVYAVPDDHVAEEVEIVAVDDSGRNIKYGPKLLEPGSTLNEKIKVEGKGHLEVIVDKKVVQTIPYDVN